MNRQQADRRLTQIATAVLVTALALVGTTLAVRQIYPYLDKPGDNARYLILGKALLTRGDYCQLNVPGCPAEVVYPPGYPVLLAGLMALTGTASPLSAAVLPARWLNAGLFALVLLLLYALVRRRTDHTVALLTTALAAVSPPLVGFASLEMSELPYLTASLAAIWLLERGPGPGSGTGATTEDRGRWGAVGLAVGVLALAVAFYLRSVGGLLAVAVAVDWAVTPARPGRLKRGRWADIAALVLVLALLCGPWLLRSALLDRPDTDLYLEQLLMRDPYDRAAGRVGLVELAGRVPDNTRLYLADLGPNLLPDSVAILARLPGRAAGGVGWVLNLGLAGLALLGAIRQWRRGSRLIEVYTGLTLLLYLLWPWRYLRFIVPIWPFLITYLVAGLEGALGWLLSRLSLGRLARWPGWLQPAWLLLLALPFLLSGLRQDLRTARYYAQRRDQPTISAFYGSMDPEWGNYFAAAEWLAANAPADAVIMARKYFLLYPVVGERPTVGYPLTRDTAALPEQIARDGVDFIVEEAFSWDDNAQRFLRPALAANPGLVELAYQTGEPAVRVWRIVQGAQP